jgi:hypothetical protein
MEGFLRKGNMKTVQISDKENIVLKDVLESTVSDLRAEIAQTDSPFFKDQLREKKETLLHILKELEE